MASVSKPDGKPASGGPGSLAAAWGWGRCSRMEQLHVWMTAHSNVAKPAVLARKTKQFLRRWQKREKDIV